MAGYWLLFYDYVGDIGERRGPHRDAHLRAARAAYEEGTLLAAGALTEPLDGAVFVFRAEDQAVVEEFAATDPYVTAGLVTGWRVRPWNVVVGGLIEED